MSDIGGVIVSYDVVDVVYTAFHSITVYLALTTCPPLLPHSSSGELQTLVSPPFMQP